MLAPGAGPAGFRGYPDLTRSARFPGVSARREPYFPNVYEAKWHRGHLLVTERGSGLYVLEMDPTARRE